MRWLVTTGLMGWTVIVALAWWLAERRIPLCEYSDETCIIKATATRDAVLTHGLTVALVVCMIALLSSMVRRTPEGRWMLYRVPQEKFSMPWDLLVMVAVCVGVAAFVRL